MAPNPFRPTFGTSPPLLVGREAQLDAFAASLEEGPGSPGRATVYTGARGVGKTVMLNAVEDLARQFGCLVVSETATPGLVDRLIRDGLPTRVYYASMGGFDTHGGQLGTHANLMRQLGDAVLAFQRDLREQRNEGRVLTMVFSEFGRRVKQNASGGTDHGTAAPHFVFGPAVRGGRYGQRPSLAGLRRWDRMDHHVDLRLPTDHQRLG